MKKFIVTILCFVYMAASSGATINFHYCMGKFIGWDVAAFKPSACNNCGMPKEQKKGCCNDKHTTLQLNKDQLASNINHILNSSIVYIQQAFPNQILLSIFNIKNVAPFKYIPPLILSVSAYILNNVFRI